METSFLTFFTVTSERNIPLKNNSYRIIIQWFYTPIFLHVVSPNSGSSMNMLETEDFRMKLASVSTFCEFKQCIIKTEAEREWNRKAQKKKSIFVIKIEFFASVVQTQEVQCLLNDFFLSYNFCTVHFCTTYQCCKYRLLKANTNVLIRTQSCYVVVEQFK